MKWEYLLRYLKYDDFRSFEEMSKEMATLGDDGWELVSVAPDISTKAIGKPLTVGFAYYFKRARE